MGSQLAPLVAFELEDAQVNLEKYIDQWIAEMTSTTIRTTMLQAKVNTVKK